MFKAELYTRNELLSTIVGHQLSADKLQFGVHTIYVNGLLCTYILPMCRMTYDIPFLLFIYRFLDLFAHICIKSKTL